MMTERTKKGWYVYNKHQAEVVSTELTNHQIASPNTAKVAIDGAK